MPPHILIFFKNANSNKKIKKKEKKIDHGMAREFLSLFSFSFFLSLF